MWGNRGVVSLARWTGALLLLAAAVVAVLLAFQERATADFLASLSTTPGMAQPTDSAAYYAAYWLDLGVAVVLISMALAVALVGDRLWFALTALLACLGGGSGIWALARGGRAEVRTVLPLDLLAIVSIALGGLLVVDSVIGFLTSPPLVPVAPANPPVPPSHQAG